MTGDDPTDPYHDDDDISNNEKETILAEALNRCAIFKNASAALQILMYRPGSELCRARAISICGSCGKLSDALQLLSPQEEERQEQEQNNTSKKDTTTRKNKKKALLVTAGPYNAAIAACGNAKHWQGALDVLDTMPQQLVTSITINAVLTALGKERRGVEALQLIRSMQNKWNIIPDRISYHTTLTALLGNHQIEESCLLVREMAQSGRPEIMPNKETSNRISSAVAGKEAARALVVAILGDELMDMQQTRPPTTTNAPSSSSSSPAATTPTTTTQVPREFGTFQKWELPKHGRGKSAYWKIGQLSMEGEEHPIIVGLSPNRNPAANGLRIHFYRQKPPSTLSSSSTSTSSSLLVKDQKLGFLLMINSITNDNHVLPTSQFLGQCVAQDERGHGWAKIWIAIWLQLCLDAGIVPRTGHMHKPLLCLVLQQSFGMQPNNGGVDVELSPGTTPNTVRLYSSSRALAGVFSQLDLRKQNIELSNYPSHPRGREIVVATSFESPGEQILRDKVDRVLRNRWTMIEDVYKTGLREILLGV